MQLKLTIRFTQIFSANFMSMKKMTRFVGNLILANIINFLLLYYYRVIIMSISGCNASLKINILTLVCSMQLAVFIGKKVVNVKNGESS